MTKSTRNRICLWSPDAQRYKAAPLILREFALENCELWFVRMAICIPLDLLACGNRQGKVYIYSLTGSNGPVQWNAATPQSKEGARPARAEVFSSPPCGPLVVLSHPRCTCTVRSLAFSADLRRLVCSTEDAAVFVWDICPLPQETS